MVIWHICATINDPYNGMVKVIPGHAKAQAEYAKVALINLGDYRYEMGEGICSIASTEFDKDEFSKLVSKTGEPDLCIFHGIYLSGIWKFYRDFVKNKYNYIVIPHGSMSKLALKQSYLKKAIANPLIVKPFTRKALAVQFLSEAEAGASEQSFYKRSIVIGNGIEKKHHRSEYHNPPIRLTSIGRIDNYHKGLDILVEACGEIKDYLLTHGVQVRIYGNNYGNSRSVLDQMIAELGLESVIQIGNPVFGAEKRHILLRETTYFIMSSRFEGQPMAALEALSYGVPAILSVPTGLAEEVEAEGCGFAAKAEKHSLAATIKNACEQVQNHQKMSEKALICAEKYYWEHIGKRSYDTYRALISGTYIGKE